MRYDTEIVKDVKKKMITVNGKNRSVKDFIIIPEEVNNIITAEEKKKIIDLEDEEQELKSLK
jgi:hypothetical protein